MKVSFVNVSSIGSAVASAAVLYEVNDVDHLKQAIKRVKEMERKTWCFYSICISTKNKQKNSTSPRLHPADIFLAVYKTLNFGSTRICDHLKTSQWYSNNILIVEYFISFAYTLYIQEFKWIVD